MNELEMFTTYQIQSKCCFIHHLGKPEAHDPIVSVQTLHSPFN